MNSHLPKNSPLEFDSRGSSWLFSLFWVYLPILFHTADAISANGVITLAALPQ